MEDLLRFKFDQKYLILDTETEGLNLVSSRPWQISWITAQGKTIKSKNDRFVKWSDLNVSPDAARITGFNQFDYESKAEDPLKVLKDLWSVITDPSYIIVGQNLLNFDVYILNVLRKCCNLHPDYSYIHRILDTRALAMSIAMGNKDVDKSDILTQYKYISHRDKKIKTSQAALLKQYEIEHDPLKLHNALYDIEMTFKIFLKQIQEINI
jgi:DNA polymerase III epsilon subunit-like protein